MDFAESMISVHHVDKGCMDLGQRGEIIHKHFCDYCVFCWWKSAHRSSPEFTGVGVSSLARTNPLRHLEGLCA